MLNRLKQLVPYVDIWIDLMWIQVATNIMVASRNTMTYEYLSLDFRFFKRWGFRWRLYRPFRPDLDWRVLTPAQVANQMFSDKTANKELRRVIRNLRQDVSRREKETKQERRGRENESREVG